MQALKNPKGNANQMVGRTHIENLSEAPSFRIFRLMAINERNGSSHFSAALGIRLSEWRILGLVAEGDPATTRSIRETLLIDRGLLSRIVKELCARGLITSQISPKDKRQSELLMTDKGRELHQKCITFTNKRNDSMLSVLSESEQQHFEEMLDRIIQHNTELLSLKGLSND